MKDIKQHLKIRAHLGIAFYLGKEDHVETAEAWVCAETSEDPWEEQRSRLKGDITQFSVAGKWEQSERGGVFVRSFPSFFFFSLFAYLNMFPCATNLLQRKMKIYLRAACSFCR